MGEKSLNQPLEDPIKLTAQLAHTYSSWHFPREFPTFLEENKITHESELRSHMTPVARKPMPIAFWGIDALDFMPENPQEKMFSLISEKPYNVGTATGSGAVFYKGCGILPDGTDVPLFIKATNADYPSALKEAEERIKYRKFSNPFARNSALTMESANVIQDRGRNLRKEADAVLKLRAVNHDVMPSYLLPLEWDAQMGRFIMLDLGKSGYMGDDMLIVNIRHKIFSTDKGIPTTTTDGMLRYAFVELSRQLFNLHISARFARLVFRDTILHGKGVWMKMRSKSAYHVVFTDLGGARNIDDQTQIAQNLTEWCFGYDTDDKDKSIHDSLIGSFPFMQIDQESKEVTITDEGFQRDYLGKRQLEQIYTNIYRQNTVDMEQMQEFLEITKDL